MNKKILLIEDTSDLLLNLGDFLSMEGFTVFSCLSGRLAIKQLELGEMPDLIVTDLSMRDMDGFDLIEWIRNSKHISHLPIAIFSARPILENQPRALALGVACYITKPCTPDDFVRSILQLLKDN
jgi:DNA-binding response OmpR family regulator